MVYKLKTDKGVTIDYLGTFYPGEEYELSEYDVAWYEHSRGVALNQADMPEGVTLTAPNTKKTASKQEVKEKSN